MWEYLMLQFVEVSFKKIQFSVSVLFGIKISEHLAAKCTLDVQTIPSTDKSYKTNRYILVLNILNRM